MNTIERQIDWSVKLTRKETNMKNTRYAVPTFAVSASEELKLAMIKELSAEYTCVEPRLVHQAVNEAHALASLTIAPLLFLPALAEEKVQQAADWSVRQRALLQPHQMALAA